MLRPWLNDVIGDLVVSRKRFTRRHDRRLHLRRNGRSWNVAECLEDRTLLSIFTVNSLADTVDIDPGDGLALDADGNTTLRAAIMETNALAGNDTIVVQPGTYVLSIAGTGEDGTLTGDLDIANNGSLTVASNGTDSTTIDADQIDRVFHVLSGADLTIEGLTITNGNVGADSHGGGIANSGGTLTVRNSTISGNTALGDGGGIYANSGTSTVLNSTISGNAATLSGGGIHTYRGTLTVTNSTISGNAAALSGGGMYGDECTVSLGNTILAGNTAPDGPDGGNDGGTITSQGNNLIGNNSGFGLTAAAGDLVGTSESPIDPLLGPLQNNGGPTPTHALLPGSPAIDAGSNTLATDAGLTTDQRGVSFFRAADGDQDWTIAVDIGAYEVQTLTLTGGMTDDENDGDYSSNDLSLREAIIFANTTPGNDTIMVSAGTYTLSIAGTGEDGALTGDLDIANNGTVTIIGAGADTTTINANRIDRVFHVLSGANLTLQGLTITNGSAITCDGGGIFNDHGTLTVANSVVSGNSATRGYRGNGGGLYNSGTLTVTHSTISGNTAIDEGGGIGNNGGTVAVTGSTISGNSARYKGGGIDSQGGALSVAGSTVSGNSADVGAGIDSDSGTLTVVGSTISANSADFGGGGIYANSSALTVTNSTISGNVANRAGGGIDTYSGTLTVLNSTISANSAEYGGGIRDFSGVLVLGNTIVAGNIADTGPDGFKNGGSITSQGNNLIGNQNGFRFGFVAKASDLLDVNPHLGPLQDNGGATWTHTLLTGSPAIDAGSNTLANDAGLTTDQRGASFARFVDGDGDSTSTTDIGACEAQILAVTLSGSAEVVVGATDGYVTVLIDGVADDSLGTRLAEEVRQIVVRGSHGDDLIDLSAVSIGTYPNMTGVLIVGGPGDDTLIGSSFGDVIDGNGGNDQITGGAGDDQLSGSHGHDVLQAGPGNDVVLGGWGRDSLSGGAGDDVLNGQDGRDTLMEAVDADLTLSDTQLTGLGVDRLGRIETAQLSGGAGDNKLDAVDFTGMTTLAGGDGDDELIGGHAADVLWGGEGNDLLTGHDGDDTLGGGAGNDVLSGGRGDDVVLGGLGDDRVEGNEGQDTLAGGNGQGADPGDTVIGEPDEIDETFTFDFDALIAVL